jgi:hypothetical protein
LAGKGLVDMAREIATPTSPAAATHIAAVTVNSAWSRPTNIQFTKPMSPSAFYICEIIAIPGASQTPMNIGLTQTPQSGPGGKIFTPFARPNADAGLPPAQRQASYSQNTGRLP